MPSTGSEPCDQFLTGVVAAGLGEGAAERVLGLNGRPELQTSSSDQDVEVMRAQLLVERAAFRWAHRALVQAGEEAHAEGLLSLKGGQSLYTGEMLIRDYEPHLRPHQLDAARCLNEAGHAMIALANAGPTPPKTEATRAAGHAGRSLQACFQAGAVTSVVDEALEALESVLPSPTASPVTYRELN